jgi:hypothetical protein
MRNYSVGIIGCCRQNFLNDEYNLITKNIGNTHSTKELKLEKLKEFLYYQLS